MFRSDQPRLRFARPAVRALALGALAVMLTQCEREPDAPPPAPAAAPAPAPSVPADAPVPTLSRAELLRAVTEAASAYAAGEPAARGASLAGRTFAIRTAFACSGPAPTTAAAAETAADGLPSAAWGPDGDTIRLTLTPGDWTRSALIADAGATAPWEAVEGFWLTRPWLAAETCPEITRDPLQSGVLAPSPQTVGLAAVFDADGSRIARRNGRAYAFTQRAEGDEPLAAPKAGYRLLLEGRIASFPDGRAIRCQADGPDQRPVCVAAVQLDRVAFEDAAGAMLSEWRGG